MSLKLLFVTVTDINIAMTNCAHMGNAKVYYVLVRELVIQALTQDMHEPLQNLYGEKIN